MKHPFLHPVDPGNVTIPACYDSLQTWVDRLPTWFSTPGLPQPKACILCGLPGVGKGRTVHAIARTLGRSLLRLDPACEASTLSAVLDHMQVENHPSVLWIEEPGEVHGGLHRWLLDAKPAPAFVVFTTTTPHKLPPGFMRADVVESAWHLDLPDTRQRCTLWHEIISAANPGYHAHDTVRLSQLSIRFTAGEIKVAYEHAMREAGGVPDEGRLIDAVLDLHPIAHALEENLACLRAWARVHASEAATGSVRSEL